MKLSKYYDFIQDKNNSNSLNEELGFKDVALGILALLGTFNQGFSQNNLKDPNLKNKIETVLKDEEQKQEIIDYLNKAGMKNAAEKIDKNAEDILSKLDKVGKKEDGETYVMSSEVKTNSWQSVKNNLISGYAITGVEKKVVIDTIKQEIPKTVIYYDTIDINFASDQLFEEGKFNLKVDLAQSITDSLNKMKSDGLVITKIIIESSTDKQRIGKAATELKNGGYEATNQGLSQARNNTFKKLFQSVIKDTPEIKQIVKYEQGKGVVGAVTPQDPSARYVKVTIYAVRVNKEASAGKQSQTTKESVKYTFTMSKVLKVSYPRYKPNTPGATINGSGGHILGGEIMSCPAFN